MNFTTHTHDTLDIGGTCLQGEIEAKFSELSALFGKPGEGDGYKTEAEWLIKFADGTVASIYNWKDGVAYCGAEDGKPVRQIKHWHVGGETRRAVELVQIALDLHREQREAEPEPTDPVDRVAKGIGDTSRELLESIRAIHGERFANMVILCIHMRKLSELNALALSALKDAEVLPKTACAAMSVMGIDIVAQALGTASRIAGFDKAIEIKPMLEWADRIVASEQEGAERLMAEIKAHHKED